MVEYSKNQILLTESMSLTCQEQVLTRIVDMFYEGLKQIIEAVTNQGLSGHALMDTLIEKIDSIEIYASDDKLVTDSYFSLLHYATGDERVTDDEWKYFLECLSGDRNYSLDDKLQIVSCD